MDTLSFPLFIALVLAGGWLAARVAILLRLPGIVGMLVFGIGYGLVANDAIPTLAWELDPFIKGLALIVILLRAGLGIRRRVLAQVGRTAFLLAWVPCTLEAAALTGLLHVVFGLDWLVAGLAAWMLAAVSPAVIVPSMLDFQARGLGKRNQIPTLVMAGAAVDDVVAITAFAVLLVLLTGTGNTSVWTGVALMPLSVLGGLMLGAAAGLTLGWVFHRYRTRIRATDKTLLLVVVCLLLVELGDWLSLASLLAVMTVGFVLLERAEPVAQEVAAKLAKIWIPIELLLFVYIGMQVDLAVALDTGLMGLAVIVGGLAARSLAVWAVTLADRRLSHYERAFCVAAFLPKATVQAALGAVPLALGIPGGDVILSLAVLAVLFTAPLGLILIRHLGPKLP